jgi:hypothetical protein
VRASLTASGAIAGISMPVTIAFYPPAAIPLVVLAAIATAIVVWHLSQGRRITLRRTPKGNLTIVLDASPCRAARGTK